MVISSSQHLRNSVSANLLIAAVTTQIVHIWAEVIENLTPMDKPDVSDETGQRFSIVDPLTKTISLKRPGQVQNNWDKLFDCWQGRWKVTFCSG